MKSFLVYKFTCGSCGSSYKNLVVILKLGLRSISKRITSLIFLNIYTLLQHALTHIILKIVDKANSKFDLKIRYALHISWRKHNLNAKPNHLVPLFDCSFCHLLVIFCFCWFFCWFFVCFCISLSSIIFIICTLIIGIFYCLDYILLLLHPFITHLVIDFIITL